jgi:hypothetical protein
MPFTDIYRRQAALLMRLLPLTAEEDCCALKGGTAINLLARDMPWLSAGIDLTYLQVESYEQFRAAIEAVMGRIADRINSRIQAGRHSARGLRMLPARAPQVRFSTRSPPNMTPRVRLTARATSDYGGRSRFGGARFPFPVRAKLLLPA